MLDPSDPRRIDLICFSPTILKLIVLRFSIANLGSGFPFTQTQGFYENITFSNGINTDYTSTNGDLGIQYAELNQGRLPYYHRLDLSLAKDFKFKNNTQLNITASVTNTYNRENIFYFNRVKYERVNQLPLMPSLGMSLSF